MLKKLPFRSGIVKNNTEYSEPGRYVDAQWVRFVAGYPQKMGGWRAPNGVSPPMIEGICRRALAWRDNRSVDHVAAGTHKKLYEYNNGEVTNITPLRGLNTGSLTDPISTALAVDVVTIADVAHGQVAGDWVTLTATSSVGGLLIADNYVIETTPTADSYTITASSAATATAGPLGGAVSYTYYRRLLGNDPFATISGSPLVAVTDAQTVTEGDTVIYTGASAVAGLTIDGSYEVVSAPGGGVYVIDAGSNANATTSGGGAAVSIQNELSIGLADTLTGYGFGAGLYGVGTWGTPRTVSGITLQLRTWSLWAYGEWLLANPRGDTLYVWNPNAGGRAIGFYNAPAQMLSFFVTEERYIIALGADDDPLKMRWPDQTDPNNWNNDSINNTVNISRRVQGGNYFQAGTPVRNQVSLIWTDAALFLHQWRPDGLIFTTTKIAEQVGLFGPNAYTVLGETCYWISDHLFRKWDGSVGTLPADDVLDWFFQNVDRDQRDKVYLSTIGTYNELILLYPELGHTDCNRYILIKLDDPSGVVYSTGSIARTAWLDRGLIAFPLAVDTGGNIWVHEVGVDGAGGAIDSYITAAPVDVEEGEANLDIFAFHPDIDKTGEMSITLLFRDNAQQTPTEDGPYTLDTAGDRIDVRASGAMAGFKLESNVVGGDWRLGMCRVDAQPSGSRRGT